jgi:hypothetical protein
MTNSNIDSSYNYELKELKIKEKLYTLFYELTSEIKDKKIEIDEEEYEENIRTTSVFQIIEYIYQAIQILLKKYKKENIKTFIPNNIEINQYEQILRKYENKERKLLKKQFQYKIYRDTLEYKIEEYMEMEEEFEEMKTKFKYEDGKFLENDRKDNEIIIIRQENTNLKKIIENLEKEINNKNKDLSDINFKYQNLEKKLEETKKELNLFSNVDMSNYNNYNNGNSSLITNNKINNNSLSLKNNQNSNNNNGKITKNSFYLCKNNINEINDFKILNLKSSKPSNHKNTHIHELFVKSKNIDNINTKRYYSNKNQNSLSFNKSNSNNMILEQKKINLLSRYLSYKKINKGRINNNSNNKFNNKNIKDYKDNNHTYNKHNNSCLRIIKKFPLKISQNGNLTNRESTNIKNYLKRNNISNSQNFKNQNSISKLLKEKQIKNSKKNNINSSYNSNNNIDKSLYSSATSRYENEKNFN